MAGIAQIIVSRERQSAGTILPPTAQRIVARPSSCTNGPPASVSIVPPASGPTLGSTPERMTGALE
jgi:hypothetical protein